MKSAWRSVGKRMVDFMLRKDYDTLSEILEEFRQEEKGIRARIEENNRFIREARVHLNAFSESEPEGFRYFSPRSAENIHREEINGIRKEISVKEEQNKKLNKRKKILAGRIDSLRNILTHGAEEFRTESGPGKSPSQEVLPRSDSEPDMAGIALLTERETQILVR